jgi:cell division protein FtsI (penicillin-binding protein 3)
MDDPQYLVYVLLDEPKSAKHGASTEASQNAAPTVGRVIARIAPMLGVAPEQTFDETAQVSY